MPAPLLTFLKYIFLALLYLFFLRVLRAVWIELREPRVVAPDVSEDGVFAEAFAASAAPSRPATPSPAHDAAATTVGTAAGGGRSLVVTSPPGRRGVAYPLTGEVTVGRSPGCSLSLPDDTYVSQVHARLFYRNAEWWVEDLGSTNGTYLNDDRIRSPVVIRRGDQVQFGQTVAELHP